MRRRGHINAKMAPATTGYVISCPKMSPMPVSWDLSTPRGGMTILFILTCANALLNCSDASFGIGAIEESRECVVQE
jgi:hypothetical protein